MNGAGDADGDEVDDAGEDHTADAGEDNSIDAGEDDSSAPDSDSGEFCSACGGCEETRTGLSAQHKPEPISYTDNPPMGGDHASCWTTFGVHTQEVPEARWVHNLEHGAVVFLHNCESGCAAEIKQLEALSKGRPFALITPDARLPKRFAAVAWGVRLVSDCFDADAFEAFYERHYDRASESSSSPPPGGC